MRRLGAALLATTTIAGCWAWYRNQPDPAWLCEAEGPLECTGDVTLDMDAALDGAWSPEIDVASASGRIVAAVRAEDEQALALFDLDSGSVVRTILAPANGWIQTPRFSPDGTLVVAVHQGWTDLGVSVVEVFDAETGQSVAVLPFSEPWWDCAGRLAISPDNTEIQCSGVVWDLHTGETIEILDDENRWAGTGWHSRAWAASGRALDWNVFERRWELTEPDVGERRVVAVLDLPSDPIGPGTDSAFTDTGDPPDLALLGSRDPGGWWDRWRRSERSFPLGSLTIVDDTEVAATGLLGFEPDEVGWSADDSTVWVLDWQTGRVVVVDPGL